MSFECDGPAVGVKQDNNVLDVCRVEQRLMYLGFCSFEKDGSSNIKEFTADGKWDKLEESALRAFYGMTHYTWTASRPGVNRALIYSIPSTSKGFG
jgi:hypothetical protein